MDCLVGSVDAGIRKLQFKQQHNSIIRKQAGKSKHNVCWKCCTVPAYSNIHSNQIWDYTVYELIFLCCSILSLSFMMQYALLADDPSHLHLLFLQLCPLWFVVEPCENEENETMETLVAADSLLNMECPDTLSLEQHYSKPTHGSAHKLTWLECTPMGWRCPSCAFTFWVSWQQNVIFLDTVDTLLLFFIKSVCAPHPAPTLLPSLRDVITTSATQVTVSAEEMMGAVDQLHWTSLHTEHSAAQLQSKKKGQPLSIGFSEIKSCFI